ncbi:MAG: Rpn family recombination-promoting nuclease/putative transposase [Eubacteriales bacterium]|nr:Rpn family recombination-promoting nuclease/putative transposase [Eubacteriales bacterium]
MGVTDPKGKAIVADPIHVCDLVNGGLFRGKQVLDPAKMEKVPPTAAIIYQDGNGKEKKKERTADGLFRYDGREHFALISLENQHDSNYIMPLKDMLISALLYDQQVKEIKKERKEQGEWKDSAEFLSGIRREDKLSPVCCIVFYHGEKPWEGPTRLHDMIEFPKGLERLREFCPDFKINLIDWKHVNPNHFKTGLRQLFELMPYAGNKRKMREYIKENSTSFAELDDESCDLLETFLGIGCLDGVQRRDFQSEEGGHNMCTAIREWLMDSKMIGRNEGENLTVISFVRRKKNRQLTAEEIADDLEEPLERILPIFQMISDHPEWDDGAVCREIYGEEEVF